jgi:uncharacterized protein YjbJ (UPF0337 family)
MNWDRIEGNWKQFKGRAKERWAELTDDELEKIAGRREQLIGRLQERYGIEKDEAADQVESWLKEPGVLDDWNDSRPILDM